MLSNKFDLHPELVIVITMQKVSPLDIHQHIVIAKRI